MHVIYSNRKAPDRASLQALLAVPEGPYRKPTISNRRPRYELLAALIGGNVIVYGALYGLFLLACRVARYVGFGQ